MKFTPSLFVFTLASTSLIASAQESELRESTIIVTTPGPQKAAGEMISHVSRLSRDDIVSKLSGTLGDTLDQQPGVATTYFGAGASRPVLRGLGAERVLVLSNGLGVIDASAASPDHQVTGDGIDAESIEILRGPAALAYGGQAIGGVINVIDGLIVDTPVKDGSKGDFFFASNSVNDGTEGAAKLQIASNGFVATFSASGRDFGAYDIPGFVESDRQLAAEGEDESERGLVENSFLKTTTYSAGLSWADERTFVGLSVRQTNSEYGIAGHSHAHEHEEHDDEDDDDHDDEDHDDHDHDEEESPFIDLEQTRVDFKFGRKFDGDFLKKIEAAVSYADYEHTEFEAVGEPGTRYESDGFEARFEADHAFREFEGAFGIQYMDKSFGAFGDEAFITPTDTQGIGVFLYEARDWTSGFGIEGGLRAETVSYDNDLNGEVDFDLFSGSFGAHQHWDSGWFVGAQLSIAERAPNQSELFADGPHLATSEYQIGRTDLKKERGMNLEGTLRWESAASSVGVSVFYTDFSDFIYLALGETVHDGALVDEVDELPVMLFSQDDAEFTGFEVIAAHAFATPVWGADWSVKGNLDFVEAELSNGQNVPYLPPVSFNGSVGADWGVVRTELSTTIAADQTDSGEGVLDTDGYTVINLYGEADMNALIGAPSGLLAFVDVRNLTDEEVRYSTSVLKDLVPAPGQNIRVGAKFSF